ncbi:MAG: hypothetical protein ACI8PB_004557 [Desulforhopalus sp.]|jgi:hypothetical protein
MNWNCQTTGLDMKALLTVLQQHFPEKDNIIKQWLDVDPTLQEIAENYLDCENALRYWGQSKSPEAKTIIAEYLTISKGLEQESIEVIEALVMRSTV